MELEYFNLSGGGFYTTGAASPKDYRVSSLYIRGGKLEKNVFNDESTLLLWN